MGFWGTLGKIGGMVGGIAAAPFTGGESLIPTLIGAGGSALGAAAQGMAQNRGAESGANISREQLQQNADRMFFDQMLAREQEGRASRNDAMRGLQQSEYIANWKPSAMKLSPFTRDIAGPSDMVREGARSMQGDLMARLAGNQMPMPQQRQVAEMIRKPGFFEKFAGIASPAMSLYGEFAQKGK